MIRSLDYTETEVSTDEKILFCIEAHGETTARKLYREVGEFFGDVPVGAFNAALTRLTRAGMLFFDGDRFLVADRFAAYAERLAGGFEQEHFETYYPGYFGEVEPVAYVEEEDWPPKQSDEPGAGGKKEWVKPLVISLALIFVSIGLISAGPLLRERANGLGIALALAGVAAMLTSAFFLTKLLAPAVNAEIAYKKKKLDGTPVGGVDMYLAPEEVRRWLEDNGFAAAPEDNLYYRTAPKYTPYILQQEKATAIEPFSYTLAFLYENGTVKESVEQAIRRVETFCAGTSVVMGKVVHRIVLVFVFKQTVTEEDLAAMNTYTAYDNIGEQFMMRTPILLPLAYAKESRTFYYKYNKIPWGQGSSYHVYLKQITKMLAEIKKGA